MAPATPFLFLMPSLPTGFAVGLGLSLILPLLNYFRDPPLGDFFGEWSSAIAMSAAALALWPRLKRIGPINASLPAVPAGLMALAALQLLLGKYQSTHEWFLWIAYLWMFLLAVIVGQHFAENGQRDEVGSRLAWALIIVALINLPIQLVQATGLDVHLYPFVILVSQANVCSFFGNTGQTNHTALIAWTAIAAAIHLAGVGRMPRSLAVAVVIALIFSAALTASRMAWLFCGLLALAVTLLPFWQLGSARQRLLIAGALPAAFAISGLLVAIIISHWGLACATTADRLADAGEGGVAIRLGLWRQALMVWESAPWLGSGAGSFFGAAYRLQPLGMHQPLDSYVHNLPLQLLTDFGLAGCSLFLAAVALLVGAIVKHCKKLSTIDAVLLVWLGMIGIHSMLEFPLWYVHFLMFTGLALGLLVRPDWGRLAVRFPFRGAVTMLSLTALAGSAFLLQDYRKLDRLVYLVSIQISMGLQSAEVDAKIEQAASDVHLFRLYADHVIGQRTQITRDGLDKKIADTEHLMRRAPVPENIGRLIMLKALAGDREAVELHLRRLLMFYPRATEGILVRMKKVAQERPQDFAVFLSAVDKAIAEAPKPRWRLAAPQERKG